MWSALPGVPMNYTGNDSSNSKFPRSEKTMETHYLACDLGAESGRLMLGTLSGERLALREIHRFSNTPVNRDASLQWNISDLFDELKTGLSKAAALDLPFAGISCDSWGVDYLLYDGHGQFMPPAFHYRDPRRTALGVKQAYARVDWPTIFSETGIQFMPMNTLFQLASEDRRRLETAERLLLIGDAFNYFLSGVARAEESLASTTQLYDPRTRTWSKRLLGLLGLPARLFPQIVPPGTRLGPLREELQRETRLPGIEVLASCSHDTGAAVAGVPAADTHWAYISSGTWSLLGVELPRPVLTESCRELNFTNEIGYGGTVRLLKNIVGLWMVQECRREWARNGREFDYATLTQMADEAPPFAALIDPADPRFVEPGEMPQKIAAFCRETNQALPADPGTVIRVVLESLALSYRHTLKQVERLIGSRVQRLHIVGGGSKNALLNRFTANACQIRVLAGPDEATAAGNVLVQALALGHLKSLKQARQIIRDSFAVTTFEPSEHDAWEAAIDRFDRLAEVKRR